MLVAAVKSGFAVFSERPLRVVDVRRMDNTVDQSRAGGISGSGVLGCSFACFGFTPMIANFVPSLSDVLSFQCAGICNGSDDSFVLFSGVIALLSVVPSSFLVPMNSPSPLTNSGMTSNPTDAFATALMVALSEAKTWTGSVLHQPVAMYETKSARADRRLFLRHRSWPSHSVPYVTDGKSAPPSDRRCSPSSHWRRALAPWTRRAKSPSSSFRPIGPCADRRMVLAGDP